MDPDLVEILPDRLYYLPLKSSAIMLRDSDYDYINIDDELVYWNFYLDFGPLNLGQLYRFCMIVKSKMFKRTKSKDGYPLVLQSGPSREKQTNAVYLLLSYLLLYEGMSVDEICYENSTLRSLCDSCLPFHDATQGMCTYRLTIVECLKSLHKARLLQFFDFDNFDVHEYEHFEAVENGDLNWIVYPNEKHTHFSEKDNNESKTNMLKPIMAFAGPHYKHTVSREGYVTLTPASYINYFKRKNVKLIVRLNHKMYDEEEFKQHGIDHLERSYQDGSTPPIPLLLEIIKKMETSSGGMAVHCKAGLGRTGTIIGTYLMKHFKLTHGEVIAWMRICRPGMVIGPQQHFLREIEQMMWYEGEVFRSRICRGVNKSDESCNIINDNMKDLTIDDQLRHRNGRKSNSGTDSQADGLLRARMHRGIA